MDKQTLNIIAVLCSFFVPGMGQFIKGHFLRGIAWFIGAIISFVLIFALIGLLLFPIIWLLCMIDAYKL